MKAPQIDFSEIVKKTYEDQSSFVSQNFFEKSPKNIIKITNQEYSNNKININKDKQKIMEKESFDKENNESKNDIDNQLIQYIKKQQYNAKNFENIQQQDNLLKKIAITNFNCFCTRERQEVLNSFSHKDIYLKNNPFLKKKIEEGGKIFYSEQNKIILILTQDGNFLKSDINSNEYNNGDNSEDNYSNLNNLDNSQKDEEEIQDEKNKILKILEENQEESQEDNSQDNEESQEDNVKIHDENVLNERDSKEQIKIINETQKGNFGKNSKK